LLVSLTKQGKLINVVKNSRTQLLEMRRQEVFYCPECGEDVSLKVGTKKIPHFAHKQGSACSESYERESEYHLSGKLRLFQWLETNGVSPKLEPYHKEIAQRPDIGFAYNGIEYAIEYQCSTIPEELFIKRTEAYLLANIIPIWIRAGKSMKRKGSAVAVLSGFDYLFLSNMLSNQWTAFGFCPITNEFISLQQILPYSAKNAISKFNVKPLQKTALSDLLQPNHSSPVNSDIWMHEIRKAKTITIPLYGSMKNKFLQELYANRLIPSLLPPEIGLPVYHGMHIETSPIEWQSYIFIDSLNTRKALSLESILHAFSRRVRNKDIKLRYLPLSKGGSAAKAVQEYITLLINIQVLEPAGENGIRRKRPIIIAENQIDHLENERIFYKKYGKIIMTSIKPNV
jgi:competence protein CoiA